jgi:hypothetical protein
MKNLNVFSRLILVIVLIAVFFFTSVSSVQAATVGRQIKVTACSAVRVVIKGKNASGSAASYTLNKSATNCGATHIPGWWNGTITATAYYTVSTEYPYYNGQNISVSIAATQQTTSYYSMIVPTPTERQWMIWRAQTWINDNVAYNQSSTHDGYRQDCSGYVSYVWQLTKPGTSPSGMSIYSTQISFNNLLPGDALNNPSAHTMLFVKWVDQSAGTFIAYEEENPASGTRMRTLTLNKMTGVIIQNSFYTYPGKYVAIRKKGL